VTTVAPYRSPAPAGNDGFRQLAHAEWTKFRTVHGWVIGMIVAFLVTGGLGVFAAEASSQISCGAATSSGGGSFHQVSVQHGAACTTPLTLGPGGEAVTDSFYFVHQPLAGNGSITVRVASLAAAGSGPVPAGGQPDVPQSLVPWSKAGLIIKDGTTSGSGYAAMMVTGGHGVRMQWNYTGDTAGLAGTVTTARPRWLRLARSGGTITGYDSADGVRWTQVGVVKLAGLPSTVQAGLFATSPRYSQTSTSFGGGDENGGPTQDTAVFDHVVRSGGWAAGPWTGSYVGRAAAIAQGGLTGGYQQAGGRFTVTGSGDIAPTIGGPLNGAAGHPTVTIFLIGTFAGLIAVIVVAAMFMTAEYRRGLIRTTLAASPRRARVLAAKALVLGLAAFVAGLAGAAGAVLLGRAIVHGQGLTVFPVPGLTELRVIVGTGLLVAVAAVFTLAVATMLRRSAAAIMVVIVAIVLPYFLAFTSAVPQNVGDWLLRITPAAAFALQQPMPQYHQVIASYRPMAGFFPLAPWTGFAVLCGWAAVALAGAGWLLHRRDA
jgi:ABC-type transport system involved in multi-copper enzyme maturation permease subunit